MFFHLKRNYWKQFDKNEYDTDIYPIQYIKTGTFKGYPHGWNTSKNTFIDKTDPNNVSFPSASKWFNSIVQSIHCLVVQCHDPGEVIPQEIISYDIPISMKELLESNITKEDLQSGNWIKQYESREPNPLVFAFFSSLEQQVTKENLNEIEDKREAYTDKWVVDLLRCLGCDGWKSRFRVNPSEEYHFLMAGQICRAVLDIRIDDRMTKLLCWFDESKRLKPIHTPHEHQIKCQRIAETLAFANEIRHASNGKDIEVFCIGTRHIFVTFGYTKVSNAYLDYVANPGIQEWDDPNASIVHKIHCSKQESDDIVIKNKKKKFYGYDITDPNDRKFIIESIWHVLGYITKEGIFRDP